MTSRGRFFVCPEAREAMGGVAIPTGGRDHAPFGSDLESSAISTLAARKACLGGLINRAGMQRMLSHRAVMFLAMAPTAAGGARRTALIAQGEQAVDQFSTISRGFSGDYAAIAVPPELHAWIAAVLAPRRAAYDALTGLFERKAATGLAWARGDGAASPEILAELVEIASASLLDELNDLVRGLNEQLTLTSREERDHVDHAGADIGAMLDEIQRVSLNIKMISVNALIQASRAGEAGRGFSVIAKEIRELSDHMQSIATQIGSNIRKVVAR